MDSLTHLVAGSLTPFIFKKSPKRWGLVVFGAVAGSFPDIDVLWSSGSLYGLLVLHRGISHAIIVQFFSAILLAFGFYLYFIQKKEYSEIGTQKKKTWECSKGQRFFFLFFVALIALMFHLFLDSMTLFGTQLLLPFSEKRFAFPALFIVDILYTGLAAFFLSKMLRSAKEKTFVWARIAFLWMLIYPLIWLSFSHIKGRDLKKQLASAYPVHLLPKPFSPFLWEAVIESIPVIITTDFSLWKGLDRAEESCFEVPDPKLLAALFGKQVPMLKYYRDFSPLCVILDKREISLDTGEKVFLQSFADARYIHKNNVPFLRDREAMFVMQILRDKHYRVLAYRFLSHTNIQDLQTRSVDLPEPKMPGKWVYIK